MIVHLAGADTTIQQALAELASSQVIPRIWRRDHTVWKPDPDEIQNRLGWLSAPHEMRANLPRIETFVEDVRADGFRQVLLLGMGGSSLAPEVMRKTFGVRDSYLDLEILDSTDPQAVVDSAERAFAQKTLFIVATKSGGTVETLSFFKYFYNQIMQAVGEQQAGSHFVAITDPESKLQRLAEDLQFREVFLNDPNIGGRYSALSFFGLLPAALIGVDPKRILDRAVAMADACGKGVDARKNPAAKLGVILGEMSKLGRDKATLVLPSPFASFGDWVEQLLAESTGKEGKGILPVVGEPLAEPQAYEPDRLFLQLSVDEDRVVDAQLAELSQAGHPVVKLTLQDLHDLGGQFFLWELATAIAGRQLGINPFDQPNVEAAKVLAREKVASYQQSGALAPEEPSLKLHGLKAFYRELGSARGAIRRFQDLPEAVDAFLERVQVGGYFAIQAYVNPSHELDRLLAELREGFRMRTRLATTIGYGPRYLHSTGQLHKGDSGKGLFLQITASAEPDLPIPDEAGNPKSSIGFGTLKLAQAMGDREALMSSGREVIRFHLEAPLLENIKILLKTVEG